MEINSSTHGIVSCPDHTHDRTLKGKDLVAFATFLGTQLLLGLRIQTTNQIYGSVHVPRYGEISNFTYSFLPLGLYYAAVDAKFRS